MMNLNMMYFFNNSNIILKYIIFINIINGIDNISIK